MKIIKPQYSFRNALNFDGIELVTGGAEVMSFLRSLPAEFEIVEPGMTQVRWPDGVTRSELDGWCDDLTRYVPENADILRYLRQLAAIAPVEKRKRKMIAWQFGNDAPLLFYIGAEPTGTDPRWRKVGECEVIE